MNDKKILSLLPAATEIVCALGLDDNLTGISHECDFPEHIRNRPVCTSSKVDSQAGSEAIDREVKGLLSQALSLYDINTAVIQGLRPDVIITQSQCDVCAVSLSDVESQLAGILDKDVRIISLEPHSLSDVLDDIRRVGSELDVDGRAEEVVDELEERISIIRHKLKFIEAKPSVACIEWLSPLMLAGNWTPGLVDIAGGNAVLVEDGRHSPFVDFNDLVASDPDVIVIMPCGFSIEQSLREIHLLPESPGWAELAAVKNNRVYIADGNQYFNRSGPRLVDSIEILAEIIHPKQFVFGYEGSGWIRFNVG
ncbi:cobalamin-binding protein [Flavihumibacter sp. R14]|nr:cobalamin-binding protein [Flavihumibacter soli]